MTQDETKILDINQDQKSAGASLNIYADFECLIEKIDECKNNSKKLFTTKVGEHIPSRFSLQYNHLKAKKICMIYTKVKIA